MRVADAGHVARITITPKIVTAIDTVVVSEVRKITIDNAMSRRRTERRLLYERDAVFLTVSLNQA
jgi:hypothetical protein